MNSKESPVGVAYIKYACPICGKEADSAIAMNRILKNSAAEEVKKLHNQFVGYSENTCKNCASHKDECIYIIEIDKDKSTPHNPYRTGYIWGVRKDFNLFVEHPEYVLKTKNDVQFCYMDKEFTKLIGLSHENN